MWVLRGDVCAKTYSKELKCVKNNHKCHVCGWGSSCWGGASTPTQQARELEPLLAAQLWPAGCREPGRANHQFIFTHLVLCGWCVISYWVVGLVWTSPHERALSDVWGCCYCFSFQNYGCGILLSPEMHLLKTCFWDTEVQQLFPYFSSCYPDCWKKCWKNSVFSNYGSRKSYINTQEVHNTQAHMQSIRDIVTISLAQKTVLRTRTCQSFLFLIQTRVSTDLCQGMSLCTVCLIHSVFLNFFKAFPILI